MLIGIAPRFEFAKMAPDIARIPALALEARNAIKNVNRVTPRLVSDMKNRDGGDYFFMTGATTDYQ